MKAILETKDLVKYYGSGDNLVKAIDHTDIRVEPGEFAAVVGRSGSGKSTLLHMLGGLDRPDSGKVLVEGRDIFRLKDDRLAVFRRRKIGFIFQSYNLVPSLNVWENIVLPIGLDSRTEIEVVSLLKHCVTEYGQTLVMITHDETIAQMADRMIVIEDGKVVRS